MLIAALALSIVAGWAWSAIDDPTTVLERSSTDLVPDSIGTNAALGGRPFPAAEVSTLDGAMVSTADLTGTPLVVNIWGSTCGPCRAELPAFAAAHAEFGSSVRFVGISYLPPSDREEQFARDLGIEYELFYDANGEFITSAGVAAFPVTLFVAADGTVVEQTGALDEQRLSSLIEDDLL